MILTRLERLKRDLEAGSRELRLSLIERLEEIFNLASDLAGGRVETPGFEAEEPQLVIPSAELRFLGYPLTGLE
jgi:hypothetical protein